jgi:hypothetical protein
MFLYHRSVYDIYKQRSALFVRIIHNPAARQRRERETGDEDKDKGRDKDKDGRHEDRSTEAERSTDRGRWVGGGEESPAVRTCLWTLRLRELVLEPAVASAGG